MSSDSCDGAFDAMKKRIAVAVGHDVGVRAASDHIGRDRVFLVVVARATLDMHELGLGVPLDHPTGIGVLSDEAGITPTLLLPSGTKPGMEHPFREQALYKLEFSGLRLLFLLLLFIL